MDLRSSLPRAQLYRIAGALTFVLLWELAGRSGMSSGMVPPFSATAVQMLVRLADGTFISHGIDTLYRVYTGFFLAALVGIPLGLLIGWSWRARNLFDFLIDFLRNVSSITLIPITILIIGIGFSQKVVVIFYASFFPVVLNTINGAASAKRSHIEAARSLGATDLEVMRHVLVYAALPSIFTGLRLAIGVAFIVVIAAELVGATSGLGYYLHEASRTYKIVDMFAAALFVSVLGYLSTKAVLLVGNRLAAWKDGGVTGH